MKLPAPAIVFAVVLGGASAWAISTDTWATLRPALLPALSVVAGAVLVRLARGLPFTNADHFTLSQFRRVSEKLRDIASKLRTMMFVCLAAIIQLICYPSLQKFLAQQPLAPLVTWASEKAFSALIGATTVYAFVRVLEVIQVDVALLRLQTSILDAAIASKNAKAFEKELPAPSPVAGATRFGTTVS